MDDKSSEKQTTLIFVLVSLLAFWVGLIGPDLITSFGLPLPIPGWPTGLMLFIIAGLLLYLGIPIRRYVKENEERAKNETFGARKYQLDLPTAFKIIMFARACWFAGGVIAGLFGGLLSYAAIFSQVDFVAGFLPTLFAVLGGIALAVVGYLVQGWGKLPPTGDGKKPKHTVGAN